MGRKGIQRAHQFVDDLVAITVSELTADGTMDEQCAKAKANQIANRVCFQYARTQLYVPANIELQLTPRDEEIWAKYNADSGSSRRCSSERLAELAEEYTLTERHVYRIVSMMRRREFTALQPELPGLAEAG
jgi:Mor family transcriptional regulator